MKQLINQSVEIRLEAVFKRVFGDLPESKDLWNVLEIKGWDSLAHMTLITEIEKEFSITIMPSMYLQCTSYNMIRKILIEG